MQKLHDGMKTRPRTIRMNHPRAFVCFAFHPALPPSRLERDSMATQKRERGVHERAKAVSGLAEVVPGRAEGIHVVCNGDPLEIYTDREGEVIFKKYSPIGELSLFAAQYAETLHRVGELSIVICDRDAVIACAGVPRRDYAEKQLSPEFEAIAEARSFYEFSGSDAPVLVTRESGSWAVGCAMPIISGGDLVGCVASVFDPNANTRDRSDREVESKLILTAAGFLGRQMEG